jgi:hypothetical protein
MQKLVVFKNYNNRAEAELDNEVLLKNGIKAMVASDGSGLSHVSMFTGQTNILVYEKDLEKARSVLSF